MSQSMGETNTRGREGGIYTYIHTYIHTYIVCLCRFIACRVSLKVMYSECFLPFLLFQGIGGEEGGTGDSGAKGQKV